MRGRISQTFFLLYTLQHWGEEQRDRYEARLVRAIADLADFPDAGASRSRLIAGCRVRPVEKHILYYRVKDEEIEVVRILHQRADPSRRHFG